jgi:hypothetical protein
MSVKKIVDVRFEATIANVKTVVKVTEHSSKKTYRVLLGDDKMDTIDAFGLLDDYNVKQLIKLFQTVIEPEVKESQQ